MRDEYITYVGVSAELDGLHYGVKDHSLGWVHAPPAVCGPLGELSAIRVAGGSDHGWLHPLLLRQLDHWNWNWHGGEV